MPMKRFSTGTAPHREPNKWQLSIQRSISQGERGGRIMQYMLKVIQGQYEF